jgi:thioredoxin-related protein
VYFLLLLSLEVFFEVGALVTAVALFTLLVFSSEGAAACAKLEKTIKKTKNNGNILLIFNYFSPLLEFLF